MQRWGASWSLLIQFYQLNPTLPTPPSRWLIQTCSISASFLAGIEKPSMVSEHPWWDSLSGSWEGEMVSVVPKHSTGGKGKLGTTQPE